MFVLFSNRDLRKIIIPLMIERALDITIGMLDTVMVSSAGEAAVSGVSLVDTINLLLIYLFSAMAGGGAVVISQLLGSGDQRSARDAAKQLLYVVTSVSAVIALLTLCFRCTILDLVYGGITAEVMRNAQIYFLFTALSYPLLGIYNACAAIFRAAGNSRISMVVSVAMNLINVAGNALLIFGFHMGAAGAAIATLFSRVIGAGIMLALILNKKYPLYVENLLSFRPQWALIKRICWIGVPNGIENGMFQFGKVITQSIVSGFGTAQIAANAVANSLVTIQYIPGNAIGLAMITVVGRCIGAGEKQQAKHYAKKLLGITYVAIIVISVVMSIFAQPLVGVYHLSAESAPIAVWLLLLHSVCVSTIWPIAFTLPNSFRAASDVRYTMFLSIFSMWLFRVGLSFVFGVGLQMGVNGIWLAMMCDWVFRAIFFGIRYYQNRWLTKYHPV